MLRLRPTSRRLPTKGLRHIISQHHDDSDMIMVFLASRDRFS